MIPLKLQHYVYVLFFVMPGDYRAKSWKNRVPPVCKNLVDKRGRNHYNNYALNMPYAEVLE